MTTISHDTYEILINKIAYWLITNKKSFKKRNIYEYQGRTADLGTVENAIFARGNSQVGDGLTGRYTEAAVVDNTNHDFLPNYVTYQNMKIMKANYVDMINRVLKYEQAHGTIPLTVNTDISPTPTPTPTPSKLYPYLTSQGGGKLGQRTGYSCGPHSLMQCIYRLTGIELSETTLMSVCGTTTNGTSHDGLATGLAWFNRKYGYNLKMTWKNFSEVGFDGVQKAYENGAVFIHLLYKSRYGHYEVPLTSSTDPNKILNSLGNKCGNGYCGYIENRNQATQRSYINGISQKSVCIISR